MFYRQLPTYYLLLIYSAYAVLLGIIFYPSVLALIGNFQFTAGHTDKAEKLYRIAASKNSKNPTIYLNYAILLVRDGNAAEALDYLNKAQRLNKNVVTAKNITLTMGSCYWILGEIDKAIELLEGLKKEHEYVNNHVLTTLGYMYIVKGDLEKASFYSQKAVEDCPTSSSAWDNLGQISYKSGDLEKAKEHFSKALSFNKNLVDSNYYMGLITMEENDFESARTYFETALNCNISALNTVTKEQIQEKLEALNN